MKNVSYRNYTRFPTIFKLAQIFNFTNLYTKSTQLHEVYHLRPESGQQHSRGHNFSLATPILTIQTFLES